jgi:type IV pili sensor histidine kinase/response regulator
VWRDRIRLAFPRFCLKHSLLISGVSFMSFTERAGLFPVLLLTGCAQPAVITGPPSSSVVDSMLSRSAADISAMQYRVHQTGPSAQRPAPTASAKSGSPLLAHAASTSPLTVKPAAMLPVSAASAGPADGFVRQDGAEPTLRAALRKIIPPGHTVVFDKAVFADTPQLWRWKGNDRWQYVANKMLAMRGLNATVNEKAHMVTVEPAQRAQTAHATTPAVSMPVPGAAPVKSVPAGAVKATSLPTIGRNPFSGGKVVASSSSDKQTNIPGPAPHTSTVFAKAPVVVQRRHWHIETGYTVRDWLSSQAAAETCTVPGIKNWTIAWLTPTNYRIDAPLNFDGSFREMLDWLFTLYGAAKIPLYAGVHAAQCVVPVDDKEVH